MQVHKFFILQMPTPEVEGLKALTNQLRCWSCHLSFLTRAEIYQIFLFILAEAICLVAKWLTLSIHSSYHVNLKVNSEINFLVTCSLSVTYQVHATLRHLDKLSWVFYAWARLAQTELDRSVKRFGKKLEVNWFGWSLKLDCTCKVVGMWQSYFCLKRFFFLIWQNLKWHPFLNVIFFAIFNGNCMQFKYPLVMLISYSHSHASY